MIRKFLPKIWGRQNKTHSLPYSQVLESSPKVPRSRCSIALRFSLFSPLEIFFFCSLLEMGTHLKIFMVVSPIVTHFFSLQIQSKKRGWKIRHCLDLVKKIQIYQCLTLSTACITRLTSSLALLLVSARTDRDIFAVDINKLAILFIVWYKCTSQSNSVFCTKKNE